MIQLDFDARDRARGADSHADGGRLQPARGRRAGRLGRQQARARRRHASRRPPGRGSHANFYGEALFLGASGSQGVGCDDTRGPDVELHPKVLTIPSDPAAARARVPLDRVPGTLGRAPAGVLQRADRAEPQDAVDRADPLVARSWRDRSFAVPAGGAFGTGATDFFCGAVGRGSSLLTRALGASDPRARRARRPDRGCWRSSPRGPPGGRPLRCVSRGAAPGARSSRPRRACTPRLGLFVGIGRSCCRSRCSTRSCRRSSSARRASSASRPRAGQRASSCCRGRSHRHDTDAVRRCAGPGRDRPCARRARQGRQVGPIQAYRLALGRLRPMLGALVIAGRDRLAAREHDRPAADRDRARDPLGADRPRDGARGAIGHRRAQTKRPSRRSPLAEGGVPQHPERGVRARGGTAARLRARDPHDGLARRTQRGRGCRVRRAAAVCRTRRRPTCTSMYACDSSSRARPSASPTCSTPRASSRSDVPGPAGERALGEGT